MVHQQGNNMNNKSYDELCGKINNEFKKIKDPKIDDLLKLSKKLDVEISVIRECIGLKDSYEFQIDKDQSFHKLLL